MAWEHIVVRTKAEQGTEQLTYAEYEGWRTLLRKSQCKPERVGEHIDFFVKYPLLQWTDAIVAHKDALHHAAMQHCISFDVHMNQIEANNPQLNSVNRPDDFDLFKRDDDL